MRLSRQLVGKSGSPQIFDNARDDCFVVIGLGLRKAPKRQAGIKHPDLAHHPFCVGRPVAAHQCACQDEPAVYRRGRNAWRALVI
jgi:hypothetical protein